jgi:predicted ArsR family transcriptional regulator
MDAAATEQQRALQEPRRRAVYDYVRGSRWPVTREDVADAIGVSRSLAAFHLERLVDAALIETVETRPAAGSRGGRPPKQYRAVANVEVNTSVPPRRYQVAGEILVRAIAAADTRGRVRAAANELAAELGERASARGRGKKPELIDRLGELGYEPVEEDGEIVLANCPFHALAVAERNVTCELNHAFVEGVLRACGETGRRAELTPAEGRCCVVVSRER